MPKRKYMDPLQHALYWTDVIGDQDTTEKKMNMVISWIQGGDTERKVRLRTVPNFLERKRKTLAGHKQKLLEKIEKIDRGLQILSVQGEEVSELARKKIKIEDEQFLNLFSSNSGNGPKQ